MSAKDLKMQNILKLNQLVSPPNQSVPILPFSQKDSFKSSPDNLLRNKAVPKEPLLRNAEVQTSVSSRKHSLVQIL
jgi:hypothetical protein